MFSLFFSSPLLLHVDDTIVNHGGGVRLRGFELLSFAGEVGERRSGRFVTQVDELECLLMLNNVPFSPRRFSYNQDTRLGLSLQVPINMS